MTLRRFLLRSLLLLLLPQNLSPLLLERWPRLLLGQSPLQLENLFHRHLVGLLLLLGLLALFLLHLSLSLLILFLLLRYFPHLLSILLPLIKLKFELGAIKNLNLQSFELFSSDSSL